MTDKIGRWFRRVLRVRHEREFDGAAYDAAYDRPPIGKEGDPDLVILNRAIQDIDRLGTMFQGILTLRAQLAKFASLIQAIQEAEKRLVAVREAEETENCKLAVLKTEVAEMEARRDQGTAHVTELRGQLLGAAGKLADVSAE